MRIRAVHKNARIAPRKVRVLRDVVVGRPAAAVQHELGWHRTDAARLVRAVLNSAVANAEHNYAVAADNLRVVSFAVQDGFRLKRFQPAGRGMAHPFVKRTSHIMIELAEIAPSDGKRPVKQSAIETIAAADYLSRREAPTEQTVSVQHAAPPVESTASERDAELTAHTKIKMMQQGGEAAQRLRRQDKGGGK